VSARVSKKVLRSTATTTGLTSYKYFRFVLKRLHFRVSHLQLVDVTVSYHDRRSALIVESKTLHR
jgi:hypothetical protein